MGKTVNSCCCWKERKKERVDRFFFRSKSHNFCCYCLEIRSVDRTSERASEQVGCPAMISFVVSLSLFLFLSFLSLSFFFPISLASFSLCLSFFILFFLSHSVITSHCCYCTMSAIFKLSISVVVRSSVRASQIVTLNERMLLLLFCFAADSARFFLQQ